MPGSSTPDAARRSAAMRGRSTPGSSMPATFVAAVTAGFALAALAPISAVAQRGAAPDGARLVEEARCIACHQMNDVLLGPPWAAIAARHAARKDIMTDVLALKIVQGGGGNWGLVPMVPNQQVSIDEARAMSAWILSLAREP
jgi:cytochrome c